MTEAFQALAWNICVWFAFIVGTEFFIAYPSESPFRELLALGLLMALVIALVPDSPRLAAERPDLAMQARQGGAGTADQEIARR
jgi:hypothetical protein